jgi:hypothetical protein
MRWRQRAARLLSAGTALACAAAGLSGCSTADPVPASVHDDAAATPPMGWSSWSFIRQDPTAADIDAQARALKTSGLLAHGYRQVNLDDFYYLDPATQVDMFGRWATDRAKFPDGIAAVAAYVHSQGERFGIYLTPGVPVAACKRNTPIQGTTFHAQDIVSDTSRFETNYNFGPGSMYYIDYQRNPVAAQAFLNSWADELAEWGVDYVKLDGIDTGNLAELQHWAIALKQTGRSIYLGLSNGSGLPDSGVWRDYANSWRIDHDVECYCADSSYPLTEWANVAGRFTDLAAWQHDAGPGGWNDLDSLEVGNGAADGLTTAERQTQVTLWAMANAPLMLGTDLTHLDPADTALLTNDQVIAVDQSGHPAHLVGQAGSQEVWATANGDGSFTVALFNLGNAAANVTATWASLGFAGAADVHDLWSHADLGSLAGSVSAGLAPHASRLFSVRPGR